MALSEKEQQLLAQMEAALAAEDPKLAHTLRGNAARGIHKKHVTLAGLGVLVGVALLVAGMSWHWSVSIVGFLVMLGSVALALSSWRPAPPPPRPAPGTDHDFLTDLEEKWRRRTGEES